MEARDPQLITSTHYFFFEKICEFHNTNYLILLQQLYELHVEVYHEDVYIQYKQDHRVFVQFVEKDHR
jgi:hypothetical protein